MIRLTCLPETVFSQQLVRTHFNQKFKKLKSQTLSIYIEQEVLYLVPSRSWVYCYQSQIWNKLDVQILSGSFVAYSSFIS